MFEAVVTLCLDLAAGPCRDQLLPGYEAGSQVACEAALAAHPPVLPARPASRGAPRCVPSGPALAVVEVAPGIFVHEGLIEEPDMSNRGDVSNLGFVVGKTAVAVIDTGTARWMGEALWRAIRARTDLPVTHVVLTHMHPDHVFGTGPFAEVGAQVVGHAGLPRALLDRQQNYLESIERLLGGAAFLGTTAPEIGHGVEDSTTIELGGRMLELTAWPPAHTGTDLTVFDPATGILFAGDLVFHRHTPALDGSLTGWRTALQGLAALELAGLVPGHGDALLDWPSGGADLDRYLGVLEADTRAAIEGGARLGEAARTIAAQEAAHWQLFEAYNPRNATVAFTELEWE